MAGRRRGARSGRGWDAAPPRAAQKDHTTTRGIRRGQIESAADQSDEAGLGIGGEVGREVGSRGGREAAPGAGRGVGLGGGREVGPGADPEAGQRGGQRVGRAAEKPRDEGELAREICLRQLAVRPRTRAELATAMARRGISEEVAAEVLDRYGEVGMIDDSAFARAWVSSRHHGRGLARRALASELRQRGVDGETVDEALEDLDPDTEAATARELVDRRLRTATGAPDVVFRRLVSMLARKGYAPGLAIRVVKDALAAQSAEAAEFVDGVDADALADLEGPPPP